jgi:MoxR-like ATPase
MATGSLSRNENLVRRSENEWRRVAQALTVFDRVFLWGPPGVGKTHAAKQALNMNTWTVTCHADASVQELLGHYVPKGAEFVWHDGPVALAMRSGALVINEVAHASPEVLDAMLGILDDKDVAEIALPTGEVLVPHAGFRVIGTSNEPLEAGPLLDRFEAVVPVTTPHPGVIARLERARKGLGAIVLNSYSDPKNAISPRRALALAKALPAFENGEEASLLTCGSGDVFITLSLAKGGE